MTPEPTISRPEHAWRPGQAVADGGELRYPAGSLVLLAGLPGAGKSTLLARLYRLDGRETAPVAAAGEVRVIDSRQARNWWSRFLGPVPPRARTPIVHLTHVLRIARAVSRGHPVIAHTRGTWPHLLYGFARLARGRGGMHLILLDVPPAAARAGQIQRGRVVTAATFARHCRRWRVLIERARSGRLPPAASVTVLDRAAADALSGIRFGPRPADS
ncbi:hypothetical protein Sme01_65850 [Sphaerisporangium melleum]|uniref:Uncharacterized protein n=1 Tax=Sphaerisporangium melleum TaxID=321316 RepID=A0A917RG05_9ACTN|nr:ATP-binding protein [Sphaerisporangium melleum]GGL04576.1 hypothetical protein GCM10007964_53420 [Sphaerisporangium melleum]GII74109.1 hypothetical protein Sme01_65850 [Sphaerisporangium melleum]